ncbi:hypothetical protein Mkiyose1665_42900 [Mycobacterium kiyosense]|uniref:eCIS core domain-containing protein n=3 Tax=Mycobacteriaceae TaxID=1762 RepID=A0A9P3UVB2_9MYCO|nr:hypothetical protein MKCMC460_00220 [Mycobacterium sp. 20KCMC460]GLB83540.1 hypothetical protein SRL2020028_27960 [Mycobacterium kiyosense]GLB91413.1 hypothetical protein SRL2020130_42300 [Mycobacterium kiyosense]GLB97563.1 hypothetical protein SRL2020226_43390 [Mycobacterium kiyosense]GLC04335.1 hypothetical protein SRL2020400_49260 [Mycobacterium kiyosense]
MEHRYGRDFSKVRLHADTAAAESAHAIHARAYTVGQHIAFGAGQFAPHNSDGLRLITHELAHVVQQTGSDTAEPVKLDNPAHAVERDAERGAESGRVAERTQSNVVHRSFIGSLLGGVAGAGAGAALGGLVGGPIGAIVGGFVGMVGGAIAGNAATTKERALTTDEINYAKEIFVNSLDYSKIRITRDSMYATGAPRTIGNTIHLKSSWGHFKGDGLELTEEGRTTLIHEMTHAWQFQNGGLAYIPQSVIAQIKAALKGGDRGGAYDWRAAHKEKLPWSKWNPEQQASAVEDYNKLLRASKDKTATPDQIAELAVLSTYVRYVVNRQGAPSW